MIKSCSNFVAVAAFSLAFLSSDGVVRAVVPEPFRDDPTGDQRERQPEKHSPETHYPLRYERLRAKRDVNLIANNYGDENKLTCASVDVDAMSHVTW